MRAARCGHRRGSRGRRGARRRSRVASRPLPGEAVTVTRGPAAAGRAPSSSARRRRQHLVPRVLDQAGQQLGVPFVAHDETRFVMRINSSPAYRWTPQARYRERHAWGSPEVTMRVLFADAVGESTVTELEARGHTCVVDAGLKAGDLPSSLGGFDALVVRSTKVGREVFENADRLALVIRAGAGTNTIDTGAAAARGVLVANLPGRNAIAVAELTMGLLLAVDRRIVDSTVDLPVRSLEQEDVRRGAGPVRVHDGHPRARLDRARGGPARPGLRDGRPGTGEARPQRAGPGARGGSAHRHGRVAVRAAPGLRRRHPPPAVRSGHGRSGRPRVPRTDEARAPSC